MKIKIPAVFLSFDDCHLAEWHEVLPLFEKYNVRVTFYISYVEDIDESGWRMIGGMRKAGHTIGYHGLRHGRAGNMVKDIGCESYLKKEIGSGLKVFKRRGFDNIRHFSYPYGNRTEDSDKCLLTVFDTLRMGGVYFYVPASLDKETLIHSMSFGARAAKKFGQFQRAMQQNKIICTYMHRPKGKIVPAMSHPMEYWLEEILKFGRKKGATFYPMEVLNR